MTKETIDALNELAKAAARSQGWDENEVTFSVCKTRTTTCTICNETYEVVVMEEPCPHCGAGFFHQIFDDELKEAGMEYQTDKRVDDDDYDDSEHWLCSCGEFIETGLHCPSCGAEPPWGCPCSFCQDGDDEDDDDYPSYSDVMREDW